MTDQRVLTTGRGLAFLFAAAILSGSFLLFLVQPMIARMALPRLGGAPAVWNSAMLVYQALLLGGYAYAHLLTRLPPRRAAVVHLVVLAAAAITLPIGLADIAIPPGGEAAIWAPWLLLRSIGPLFFAVAAGAPLLQCWFALASGGRDPYALYAASNLGSFGGLLAYPLLVEPLMTLHAQSWLWSGGYLLLFVLIGVTALTLPRIAAADTPVTSPAPARARVLLWLMLAAVPTGLMMATSVFITTDIVAVPLIWVLPLGLYLLSFTVAFATNRATAELLTRVAPITILLFGGVILAGRQTHPFLSAGMALVLVFMAAVALHTRLYESRPEPDRLTGFYLAMAAGGALGGVFTGLLAPVIFDWTYEYPLLVLAAGALAPQFFTFDTLERWWTGPYRRSLALGAAVLVLLIINLGVINPWGLLKPGSENLLYVAIAVIGLLALGARAPYLVALAGALVLFGGYRAIVLSLEPGARTRSYFGVYTVQEDAALRTLAHGTTIHGVQMLGSAERERFPTSYYVPQSGIGRALVAAPSLYGGAARVGVVGLGTGTLACYAMPGQRWRFYEIDPAMIRLARDQARFTFLKRCLPDPVMVLGDARVSLEREPAGSLDLLALDAFSSDTVPMHMLTTEAFATYARVLPVNGLLLVHISNRFLKLEPVVSAAAVKGGWQAAVLDLPTPPDSGLEVSGSSWIALTRDGTTLRRLVGGDPAWTPLPRYPRFEAWSDDHASPLPVLRALDPEPGG